MRTLPVRREENINLRVTRAEKALIEEKAKAAGLGTSEWLRLVGTTGSKPAAAVKMKPRRAEQPDGFEARVKQLSQTMPRRNAETLVRREMARAADAS